MWPQCSYSPPLSNAAKPGVKLKAQECCPAEQKHRELNIKKVSCIMTTTLPPSLCLHRVYFEACALDYQKNGSFQGTRVIWRHFYRRGRERNYQCLGLNHFTGNHQSHSVKFLWLPKPHPTHRMQQSQPALLHSSLLSPPRKQCGTLKWSDWLSVTLKDVHRYTPRDCEDMNRDTPCLFQINGAIAFPRFSSLSNDHFLCVRLAASEGSAAALVVRGANSHQT